MAPAASAEKSSAELYYEAFVAEAEARSREAAAAAASANAGSVREAAPPVVAGAVDASPRAADSAERSLASSSAGAAGAGSAEPPPAFDADALVSSAIESVFGDADGLGVATAGLLEATRGGDGDDR